MNTCHVCALTDVYSMRMIMHEFMKKELCMCIEMHTCDVMHVGELRILEMATHMGSYSNGDVVPPLLYL